MTLEAKPMRRALRCAAAALASLPLAGAGAASASPGANATATGLAVASIEGVSFAPEHRREDAALELRSLGLLRWYFLKGYVAGLYLGDGVAPAAALDDVPKRLEIHYFHGIPGEKFGPAAESVLRRSLDPATFGALRERVDRMASLFEDVQPGDRYSLTYVPGRGTELAKNGEPLGSVPGADFAAAYFGIWLGPQPLDRDLRDQLLRDPS
jgi:hypothetical protein